MPVAPMLVASTRPPRRLAVVAAPRPWGAALVAVALIAACGPRHDGAATRATLAAGAPPADAGVADTAREAPDPVVLKMERLDEGDSPDTEVLIDHGECSIPGAAWPVAAIDAEAEVELAAMLRAWLAPGDRAPGPRVASRHGVVFAQSEEDRGDDPPYPASAAAESQRVCGSATAWLRTHLRQRLAGVASYGGLRCQGAVCCYDGMEYAPNGTIVFRRVDGEDGPVFVLDAWFEIYQAAIAPEIAAANQKYVVGALKRLARGTCAGEPDRID